MGAITLFDSYHCSRYNTNTGVLTPQMFHAVVAQVRKHLDATPPSASAGVKVDAS
jgi:uracil-DNA glycosylase